MDRLIKDAMRMYQVTPMTLTYRKHSYYHQVYSLIEIPVIPELNYHNQVFTCIFHIYSLALNYEPIYKNASWTTLPFPNIMYFKLGERAAATQADGGRS